MFGDLSRHPNPAHSVQSSNKHQWCWVGHPGPLWQCGTCLRTTADPSVRTDTCTAVPLGFAEALRNDHGHRLWSAFVPSLRRQIVYCARCAYFGSPGRVAKLREPCPGKPTSRTYERYATDFAQGFFPKPRCILGRPWPLAAFATAAATSHSASVTAFPDRLPFDADGAAFAAEGA
jgi:hypothetical protein